MDEDISAPSPMGERQHRPARLGGASGSVAPDGVGHLAFLWIEGGWLLVLSELLTALTVCLVRRRAV